MKKIFWILFTGLAMASCNVPNDGQGKAVPAETFGQGSTTDTLVVETARAELRPFVHPVQAAGKIKAVYEELILAPQGGVLVFCKARNGLQVKQQELIASLETGELELRGERIEAQLFNARKEYESQLLGYEALLREKTPEEAEAVRQKLKASAGLLALEIDRKELERDLAESDWRAPIDGVLTQVKIQQGMTIRPGQELYRIYSAGNLYLEAKVLESELNLLSIGQAATLRAVAAPDIQYEAVLSGIDPMVDENGLVTVQISIPNPRRLLLGMNATAEIKTNQKKGMIIPRQAVVLRNNRPVVFTLENGLSKWNYVTTGMENSESVEIVEGLQPGTEVIVSNNIQLAHQAPVKKR